MSIDEKSQVIREKIILAIYVLYTLVMVTVVISFQWDKWILSLILAGLALCLFLYFKKAKTYSFRAFITTTMIWMDFSIYLIKSNDFIGSFSTMVAMIVLLSVYCVPKLSYVGAGTFTLHLIYHFLLKRDILFESSQEGIQIIFRIATVYVALYITYQLMKTQVKSNEIMLENMKAIKEAEQSKDDFMANMSHEIRTPINTVCGISEMILQEDLTDEAREGIFNIQTAGRQLLSLVSDILDFTELSSGKMEIVPDTYNLTSTVNDVLNMAVAKASGKNIELIVDCDARIPRGLVGDEQKIRRAIMNVIDNAIKFTNEGGILISFNFRKETYGGNLVVTVKDTGIGIKEDKLETLFNNFKQIDSKRNRKIGGMGLGLSIAKVIANRMGGFISVKSVFGAGTEVQMVFPQKVNDTAPIAELKNPAESKSLLYLDVEKYSNALIREGYMTTIHHITEYLGIYYRHAKSLAECKRRLQNEEFNHLFVSWKEYCEDKEFFNELSKKMDVALILERNHKESITGSHLLCVYKPFYVLSIAAVLNKQYIEYVGQNAGRRTKFTAPDARVLVVDDNLMNLKVLEGLLRPYKMKVSVAESGKEALEKIVSERYDLVFMDHMMPDMDGIETFHRIRQKPGNYFQTVPIIALTANAIGGAREMFLQEGFSDYVSKPIELSALERTLRKFIPESKIISADGGNIEPPSHTAFAIEGIDTNLGISYCGGKMDDYIEVVQTYYKIGADKKSQIEKSYSEKNWKDYTTLVHAVKSTSLGIGATRLSNIALELEEAGKKEDEDFIASHTEEMILEYEKILSSIEKNKTIFPDGANKDEIQEEELESLEEIGEENLKDCFQKIRKAVEEYDSDSAKSQIECLFKFTCKEKNLRQLLETAYKKIDDFDYDGTLEELGRLGEELK